MANVSILVRARRLELNKAIGDLVRDAWHPDFTLPRIYALAVGDRELVDDASRAVARIASQNGFIAPVYNLADCSPGLEPTCKHRFGITDLVLDTSKFADENLFAIGMWTRLAPRSRRLMMRISPQLDLDIIVNAEVANPVLLIQTGVFNGEWFAIVADDLIAAEVVGRALRAVASPDDWDGINPWQHPLVQIGIERNLGIRGPEAVNLNVDSASTFELDQVGELVQSSAEMLNIACDFALKSPVGARL